MSEVRQQPASATLAEILKPGGCALVCVDLQNDYLMPGGSHAKAGNDVSLMGDLLARCSDFTEKARAAGVMVVHVRLVSLPDGRSDSPSWRRTQASIANVTEYAVEGTWGAGFCDQCAPQPGEPVVTKYRSSAFVNTNLDTLLRSNGIETVVVIGVQTPGCVEATFRDACYRDYYTVLVEDCVGAYDQALHEASLLVQRARHDVLTAEQVVDLWRAHE